MNRIADARRALTAMGITIEPLTAHAADLAADLRARHQHLRLPDAMVLATAALPERDLLTYDARLARPTD